MKKYMSCLDVLVILTCLMGALVVMTNEARSKTPDGETPAVESVCDGLSGAAFGLCNSYCEAMDCDSPNPRASEQACSQVLDNFMKKTDGKLPPCSKPAGMCPCDFASILSFFDPLLEISCPDTDFDACYELDNSVFLTNADLRSRDVVAIAALSDDDPGEFRCVSLFLCQKPTNPLLFQHQLEISEAEFEVCQSEVREIADSKGIPCIDCGGEGELCCSVVGAFCDEGLTCVEDNGEFRCAPAPDK